MRFIFLFVLLLTLINSLSAQTLNVPVTAVYTRVNTYSRLHADAFSFTGNQAALAGIDKVSVGIYGERRFMLQDLNLYSAVFTLPTSSGNFGLKADYYGHSSLNESQVGLAYARRLGSKLDVGVQFNYNMLRAGMYGSASAINFDVGAIFHLTESLHTGVHVYNPTGAKIGNYEEEKLPTVYNLGLGYDVSERFYFGAEVEKLEDRPLSVNAGMQYKIDKIIARAGISSGTSLYYLGLGVILNDIRFDATASVHPQLGLSPGLLILYSFKR